MLYAAIGLRLIDDITGGAPFGRIQSLLDVSDGAGGWRETSIRAVVTPGGVLAYVALERKADPAAAPSRRYRVRVEADFYQPEYRRTTDGVEFDAYPYNDTNQPAQYPKEPQDLALLPAPGYPFPTHVPVLRGVVVDGATGAPVADAWVSDGLTEHALSDQSGAFGLPLRWTSAGVPTPIDATDRLGRTGTIIVTLPGDLSHSNSIPVF